MKHWGVIFVAGAILGGCSGGEVVHLTNQQGRQIVCGPFSNDRPIAQYLENTLGSGETAQYGDTAEDKLEDCIAEYRQKGYEPIRMANAAPSAPAAPSA
ncbi:MAG: hypothetical protein RLN70_01735, partial [Rhodospirillaceae bacterium]